MNVLECLCGFSRITAGAFVLGMCELSQMSGTGGDRVSVIRTSVE
jgi:hypothetical protein